MTALEIVFWVAAGLLVYTHLGYPRRSRRSPRLRATERRPPEPSPTIRPAVSLIVAAHDEEDVIAAQGRERARARLPARAASR